MQLSQKKLVSEKSLQPVVKRRFSLKLQKRHHLHPWRKAWHFLMGLLIVTLYQFWVPQTPAILILTFFLILTTWIESQRLQDPKLNRKILKVWGPLIRYDEIQKMSTMPLYIASSALSILLFSKPIAILSILYLAAGDPIASTVGLSLGKQLPQWGCPNGKSWIGTLAGVLTCFVVSIYYLRNFNLNEHQILWISTLGALAGGAAELLPWKIDDNFLIPLFSGLFLSFSFWIFT